VFPPEISFWGRRELWLMLHYGLWHFSESFLMDLQEGPLPVPLRRAWIRIYTRGEKRIEINIIKC
jgi:hypothetical protein